MVQIQAGSIPNSLLRLRDEMFCLLWFMVLFRGVTAYPEALPLLTRYQPLSWLPRCRQHPLHHVAAGTVKARQQSTRHFPGVRDL
jgi:hypothetical protein